MGTKWFTGGVSAAPRGRIRFDFRLNGIRYRPSIRRPPSEANLRRARERLEVIKLHIQQGTFSFSEEFPNYRYPKHFPGSLSDRLCSDVFDAYLAHCQARLERGDLSSATVRGYRKVINEIWRPQVGRLVFHQIRYSQLIAIADAKDWGKKPYNNVISVVKRAFDFGYRDRPSYENPAHGLRCARIRKAADPR